jgi:hypothetical protein
LWHELDLRAKINVLGADKQADEIYRKQPRRTGLFPTWIPGTPALITIRDAAHTPE